MLRALTDDEKSFISGVADRLDSQARDRLITDLTNACAEVMLPDGAIVRFHLNGYERDKYVGQHLYPVEGTMDDADGSPMQLLLFADPSERLFELEYLRWEDGPLQQPKWSTLKFVPDAIPAKGSTA